MRAKSFLIEYNMTSLVNLFGDKLMAKWQAEGEPFKDQISNNEVATAEDLMRWMEQYDPTQNNKYITWMVNKYAGKKGGISRIEDIPTQLAGALDTYEKLSRKNLLKPEHKNINQIKTLTDLHDIADEYKEEDISSKQETNKAEEQAFYDSNDAELVFNTDEYKILIPITEEASCYFGKNTRWCTAGDNSNMFDHYDEKGPLYVILHKATNEKWQWHFESKQYMDARDEEIDMNIFLKKHKTAANVVIKHFGGLEKVAVVDPETWFKHIKNPSEEMQLAVVKEFGARITYINNPTEAVKLAAVMEFGPAIEFIENPSEEVQLEAVKEFGVAIGHIIQKGITPSEAVQLVAVKRDGYAIEYIIKKGINPSEEVQLAAVSQEGWSISLIKNPSEAVQLAAVKQDGTAIQYIENPSEETQLAAVTEYGQAIQHINNPSEEVRLAAVTQNIYAIQHIENPSEVVQLAAVNDSIYAIEYIKNPSEAVRKAAREHNNESVDVDLNRLQALSGIKLDAS